MKRPLALILLATAPGWAAIVRQAHAVGVPLTGYGQSMSATLTNCSATHAYLVVVTVANYYYDATGVTVFSTSIPSGSWNHGSNWGADGGQTLAFWYATSTAISDSETVTVSNRENPSIFAACYSGVSSTSPFDGEAGVTASSWNASEQPGSISPAQNGDLIIVGSSYAGGGTMTVDTSFSVTDCANNTPYSIGGGMADLIQTNNAAVNPTVTWSNAGVFAVGIISFKPAAVATATGFALVM